MKKHVNIVVRGLVQGVFFRASTKEVADRLNISGIVRNERDGSVYIEAEAGEDALEIFIAWCQRGPERARVESCEVSEGERVGYDGFTVTR